MPYFKKLVGKRVYLSPIDPEDAPLYTRWLNNLSLTRNLTVSSLQISLPGEHAVLEEMTKNHDYAIVSLEDDALIGNCGIAQLNHLKQSGEVGIFIGEDSFRGKGYGSEALRLLLGYAFDYLNLHSVMLRVFDFNKQGMACYKKVGFKEVGRRRESFRIEGSWHDEIYMDILEDEFRFLRDA